MNLDEFYDQDDRRRKSEEVGYGIGWSDSTDRHHTFDLFWVQDTGELYSMMRPPVKEWPHFTQHAVDEELDEAGQKVEILTVIADQSDVDAALDGWEDKIEEENSMAWVRERLAR